MLCGRLFFESLALIKNCLIVFASLINVKFLPKDEVIPFVYCWSGGLYSPRFTEVKLIFGRLQFLGLKLLVKEKTSGIVRMWISKSLLFLQETDGWLILALINERALDWRNIVVGDFLLVVHLALAFDICYLGISMGSKTMIIFRCSKLALRFIVARPGGRNSDLSACSFSLVYKQGISFEQHTRFLLSNKFVHVQIIGNTSFPILNIFWLLLLLLVGLSSYFWISCFLLRILQFFLRNLQLQFFSFFRGSCILYDPSDFLLNQIHTLSLDLLNQFLH